MHDVFSFHRGKIALVSKFSLVLTDGLYCLPLLEQTRVQIASN